MSNTVPNMILDKQGVSVPGVIVEFATSYNKQNSGAVADDNVFIGKFVFFGADSGKVVGLSTAGTLPLGVVVNNRYYNGSITDLGLKVPQGLSVQYLENGVITMLAPDVATMGQDVNVNPVTGAISTGTAAEGFVATGWKVRQSAPKDGIMFIER